MSEPAPSVSPIVGPSDEWATTAATFICDRCGADACTLTLLPPFAPDPQARAPCAPDWVPGKGTLLADGLRLSIEGPVPNTRWLLPGAPVAAIETALRDGDVNGLYALDPEYAPQWCRACGKNYCRTCWTLWIDFDEGFYDCTRGRCPDGHERIIDD